MRCALPILLFALCTAGCPEEAGPCRTALDCAPDEGCFEGECLQLCELDEDCDTGERCRHGVCQVGASVDAAIADVISTDRAMPDAAVPDSAVPDSALPDTTLPDTTLPDTALPDTLQPDAGPTRAVDGVVALYTFTETSGTVVHDVSGVLPPLDLHIEDPNSATWGIEGLQLAGEPSVVRSRVAATKVIDACTATDALTIEAWITPAAPYGYGPARVVTMSVDPINRNFTLGQGYPNRVDNYLLRLRADDNGDLNGQPMVATDDGVARLALTHVVATHSASSGTVRLYIDGVEVEVMLSGVGEATLGQARPGGYSNWNASYELMLGWELSPPDPIRAWTGTYHLVAIYDRALSASEVEQNFVAGPR